MKCNNVSRLLNRYIDNELPDNEHSYVKEHLAGCNRCAQSFNEISKLKGLLAAAAPYPANPVLLKRITEGIKNITPIPFAITSLKLLHVWITVVCILIVSSGLVMYRMYMPEPTQETSAKTMSDQILETPITPENMEKITLNLLVYTNGKSMEAPYVRF